MCVRFRKQDLTGRDFKAGWDLIGYPSASFQTLLRYTPIKSLMFRVCRRFRTLLQGQCRAVVGHCRAWLGLAFTWPGKLCFYLIYGRTSNSKMSFSSTRPRSWVVRPLCCCSLALEQQPFPNGATCVSSTPTRERGRWNVQIWTNTLYHQPSTALTLVVNFILFVELSLETGARLAGMINNVTASNQC